MPLRVGRARRVVGASSRDRAGERQLVLPPRARRGLMTRSNVSPSASPHVLIVGGGFGGLECAKVLGRAGVRVTLVDRTNHHLFQPLLYQVAMAGLSPADIAVPI